MGVCSIHKAITLGNGIDLSRHYEAQRRKIIEAELERSFRLFKEDIFANFDKVIPCSDIEFARYLADAYAEHDRKFISECKTKRLSKSDTERGANIFSFKCRALEGYFRYLNDLESLRICFDVKKRIIDHYIKNHANLDELIGIYHKDIKGTYSLQGLEELKSLLSENEIEMERFLFLQYEDSFSHLKSIYAELLNSDIIQLEVYHNLITDSK